MGNRTLQQAFVGGEISPTLLSRTDDSAYKAGAAQLQNFLVFPQGAIRSRPGFRYVGEVADQTRPTRLIPFRFSSSQNFVLVFGHYTMRIVSEGGYALNDDGSIYTLTTPYSAYDVFGLDYTQNADILTLCSPSYPPKELRRYGNTDWRFNDVSTKPTITPPGGARAYGVWAADLSEAEEAQKNRITAEYKVTALTEDKVESEATETFSGTGNYYLDGCYIRVEWGAVEGAKYYRVYRNVAGVYGFIGQTENLTIDDVGDNPDTTTTPPMYDQPFSGEQGTIKSVTVTSQGSGYQDVTDPTTGQTTVFEYEIAVLDRQGAGSGAVLVPTFRGGKLVGVSLTDGGSGYVEPYVSLTTTTGSGATFSISYNTVGKNVYPSTCGYYDQRRVFAGSFAKPLKVWFTAAGQENLMPYHLPILADDRINITAVTSDADRIRHMISLDSLVLFTGSSEMRVFTQNSDSLTPDSVAVRVQSYVGANAVQPQVLNAMSVYAAARGGHVRGMGYDYNAQGYVSGDISLRAAHLFDYYDILDLTISKAPFQVVWTASSSGKLLGCTYYPEQQVIAWHQHVLAGKVESVCSVSEGEEDHLYVVLSKDDKRWIERMENVKVPSDTKDLRYLDSFLDVEFSTVQKNINGLDHLAGKTVQVFVDGVQQGDKVVSDSGTIQLDTAGRNVAIGLPYTSRLVTVPLIANAEANLQGRLKNLTEMKARVSYTGDLWMGEFPNGQMWKCNKEDIYMQPQGDEGYIVRVSLSGDWSEQGQLVIENRDCQPIEISALIANISAEDGG